jgi:hypothetical protein
MSGDLMRDLFPLPNTRLEAIAYLARLDQLVAEYRDEPVARRVLERIRRAVESTPWQ